MPVRALSLALVLLVVLPSLAQAADGGVPPAPNLGRDAPWSDTARVLAGLPVDAGSVLFPLTTSEAWQQHAAAMDGGWSQLVEQRLAKMDAWAKAEVAPRIDGGLPLVYLFGGPDGISVDVLYPDAPRYVLFGLEVPGEVPPLSGLPEGDFARGLENFGPTLKSTINASYFVTDRMGAALKRTKLKGVMPVMLLFLARHGDTVLEVDPVGLSPKGELLVATGALPASHVPGFRVKFLRGGVGPVRELFYFAVDLENDAVKQRPGVFPFLESQGDVNAFLKAASFILHDRHFSKTRDYLLTHAASVLQDDSGLPFRAFKPGAWELQFFGEYTPNAHVFVDHFQADLKAVWDKASVRELPFRTGYPHVRGSNLLLALRKVPAADGGVPAR